MSSSQKTRQNNLESCYSFRFNHFPNYSELLLQIMELECDSIICSIQTAKLLRFSEHEQTLFKRIFECITHCKRNSADYSCNFCIDHVWNLKQILQEITLKRYRREKTHETKMQEDTHKIQEENAEEPHFDSYNCKCRDCQTKFGSLPLLVDVIEQNEEKTEADSYSRPSTSKDLSPKSPKKIMKCTHCDKEFTHRGDLNKHIRKHTGEKPYKCKICDKNFAHNSNLVRHSRAHSGVKPFKCELCGKGFYRKDKLELHCKKSKCKKL